MSLLMMLGKARTPEDMHKLLEAEKDAMEMIILHKNSISVTRPSFLAIQELDIWNSRTGTATPPGNVKEKAAPKNKNAS